MPSHGMREAAGRPSWDSSKLWNTSDPKKDAIWNMFVAVLLLELAVAVTAMLCGIMRAAPLEPGGPPMMRFPWLGWAAGAAGAPAALFLILHLAGLAMGRINGDSDGKAPESGGGAPDAELVPPRLRRFYACVRQAPTVVLLVCVLLLCGAAVFMGDFWEAVQRAGTAMTPYIPWFVGGAAAFLAVGYLGRLFFVLQHRRMEQEYAFRREVLERTGVVLVSKGSVPLAPPGTGLQALPEGGYQISDAPALPPAPGKDGKGGKGRAKPPKPGGNAGPSADDDDVVDVDVTDIRPKKS